MNPLSLSPSFHYHVSMSHPETHIFEVVLEVKNWQKSSLDLKMPVWTPGSYLVREYSRLIQSFKVESLHTYQSLIYQKISKNHWHILTENQENIKIKYTIFAYDLTVRTNHLDVTHGYFNGAALFFFIPEYLTSKYLVTIHTPHQDWQVATSLPMTGEKTYLAKDFDTLVDSPFEIGIQENRVFSVKGINHQLVVWGKGNFEEKKLIEDIQKIIAVEADMFGGNLPYNNYIFLLHLCANGFGGLEHKDCCVLQYNRLGFKNKDKYYRFMQLVAHEFFHLWNIKRIRPKELETFDYEQENYTPSLWFSEGTTSYYDLLIPLRAGIYNRVVYLDNLSKEITRYLTTYGRLVQPLAESSFDAWIKLYRRDANSDNCQISYYLKGEMVSLLLDLMIRNKFENKRSLDDVLVILWERFGKEEVGFTSKELQEVISEVAQEDLQDFFHRCLYTTEELEFNHYLEPFGLKLSGHYEGNIPYLGIKVQKENGREIIKFVEANSPAEKAGLCVGNELLSIDQFRVTSETLNERLQDYHGESVIEITIFHDDQLKTVEVTLEKTKPTRYHITVSKHLSPRQQANLKGWLGE